MLSTQTHRTSSDTCADTSRPQTAIRAGLACGLSVLLIIASPVAFIKAQQDPMPPAAAEGIAATTHYVSPGANCGGQLPCYTTPQAAVDAAADGDTIKVAAGTYTTTAFEVIRVYSKSLELLAGYSPANWDVSDPVANKTVLDPQNVRGVRGIVAQGFQSGTITMTIKGFTVINGVNSPPQSCGGICTLFANVDISNNYLYSNTAASIQVAAANGIIYNNLVQDTRTDSFTSSNMGIAIESSVITVISNTVRRNGMGIRSFSQGGLRVISYVFNNLVEDNTFGIVTEHGDALEARNNVVRRNGRGFRARDHLVPFTYPTLLTITDNLIDSSGNAGIELNFVMQGNITNNTITNNKIGISHNAGVGSTVSITANLLDRNFSGGINFIAFVPNTAFHILSNTVTNNGTPGISVKGDDKTTYTISGNWIESNKPENKSDTSSGGGLYIGGDVTVLLTNNRIARNSTNRYGGGIYIDGPENKSTPQVTMNANLILTNTAQETGSGLAMGGGIVTATNDIISRNYQERPAVYVFRDRAINSTLNASHWTIGNNGSNGIRAFFGGRVRITNSIVAGHRIAALAESLGGDLEADNILSFDNPEGVCDVAATCTNIFNGDPKFLSDKLLNFHITADSAAIDKATESAVTDDIDGPGRPVGPASDVGADEYGNAVINIYDLFLPLVMKQDGA